MITYSRIIKNVNKGDFYMFINMTDLDIALGSLLENIKYHNVIVMEALIPSRFHFSNIT